MNFLEKELFKKLLIAKRHDEVEIFFDSMPSSRTNKKKIGILIEPPAVLPYMYKKRTFKLFDQVIVMSPWLAERHEIESWSYHHIMKPEITYQNLGRRNGKTAMMNDHKFSAVSSSRYGYRREVICMLEAKCDAFDLFGTNWRMSKMIEFRKRLAAVRNATSTMRNFSIHEAIGNSFRSYSSYRGQAKDKGSTLSQYDFSIVIENDVDIITEKVFDVLFAGAIPFYLGPDLTRLGLENLVIRLPEKASYALDVIQSVDSLQLDDFRSRINDFMLTEQVMGLFSLEAISTRLSELIIKDLP